MQTKRTSPGKPSVLSPEVTSRMRPRSREELQAYRPKTNPLVAQPKLRPGQSFVNSPKRTLAGAPVPRSQPAPGISRTKISTVQQPRVAQATLTCISVDRSESTKVIQSKIVSRSPQGPKAPPVYRPQPTPLGLQKKGPRIEITSPDIRHRLAGQGRALLPHERLGPVSRTDKNSLGIPSMPMRRKGEESAFRYGSTLAHTSNGRSGKFQTVQRAQTPLSWTIEQVKDLSSFSMRAEEESEEEQTARVHKEIVPLTKFFGAVKYNCYAWALGLSSFDDPGGTLSTWMHRFEHRYTFVPADSPEATILLWGNKLKVKEDYEVLHASVLLTHDELQARAKKDFPEIILDKESLSRIPDPFWSSALGFGFGVMVHPKDFFHRGDFGSVVAGMKKKR